MSFDKDVAEYLSREEGIDPAFIEKDWHAVRVLDALSQFTHEDITIIFTGGTSLSKGYGLLKRFSEDLDFRARFDTGAKPGKRELRAFRNGVIEALKGTKDISFGEGDIVVDGLGFKIQLIYPKEFQAPEGIRPELQVEFSFTQPRLDAVHREITSLVAQYKSEPAETGFLCLSPVEIASDKFSSLVWRIHKRNREGEKDDPAMLRHLHDLCALREVVGEAKDVFVTTALESFAIDQERQNRQVGMALADAATQALAMMKGDGIYREEYQRFVDAMSYASDDEKIFFDEALGQFETLAKWIAQ